jgi:hypothetical protein
MILPDPVPGCLLSEFVSETSRGKAWDSRFEFSSRLRADTAAARLNISKAGARYKAHKDLHARTLDQNLLVGKFIFFRREARRNKLESRGMGPYLAVEAEHNVVILRGPKGPFQVSLNCIADPVDHHGCVGSETSGNRDDEGVVPYPNLLRMGLYVDNRSHDDVRTRTTISSDALPALENSIMDF